jgi:hypothetical protein
MQLKKLGIERLYDGTGKFCGYTDENGNVYDKFELRLKYDNYL